MGTGEKPRDALSAPALWTARATVWPSTCTFTTTGPGVCPAGAGGAAGATGWPWTVARAGIGVVAALVAAALARWAATLHRDTEPGVYVL